MRKIFAHVIVIFSLFILMAVSSYAQLKRPKITLGGNFIYSVPQGAFKDAYKFGLGGELYGGVGFGSTYLIGTVGASAFNAQSGLSETLTSIPVKIGLKQYFLLKKIFINGDIGSASLKAGGVSNSVFTTGVGGGLRLLGLELALYYSAFKKTDASGYLNSVNAKIGWSFSL